MARVIKYKSGKKYITDLKVGRSWRVLERKRGGRKKRKREEERPKDNGAPTKNKKKTRQFRPGKSHLEK